MVVFVWTRLPLRLPAAAPADAALPPALFFHAAVAIANPASHGGSGALLLVHGGLSSLSDTAAGEGGFYLVNAGSATVQQLTNIAFADGGGLLSRFGHTLTALPSQSLLLLGGVSFASSSGEDASSSYTGGCIVHYSLSGGAGTASDLQLYVCPLGIQVPCAGCRVYHQTLCSSSSSNGSSSGPVRLAVLGGGALCLGFGTHFCSSYTLQVGHKYCYSLFNSSSAGGVGAISARPSDRGGLSAPPIDPEADVGESDAESAGDGEDSDVILVHKRSVKAVKNLLEKHGHLDRSRRITAVDRESSRSGLTAIPLSIAAAATEGRIDAVDDTTLEYMAVPISAELARRLMVNQPSDILTAIGVAVSTDHLLLSRQATRMSRALTVSAYKKADEFIRHVVKSAAAVDEAELLRNLPRKFEVVGDAAMVAEDALMGAAWAALLAEWGETRFWAGLARALRARLVCRKGRIDKVQHLSTQLSIAP